jgi:ribose/xylose/arabinose/galactoside ABC-type transport system permease subunit
MAGHHGHVLPTPPLVGQIQSQAMSHAKFVFLIVLVVFFIALFVVAYVWMRRPDFGQKGGHAASARAAGTLVPDRTSTTARPGAEGEVVLVQTDGTLPGKSA